jgi:hypothetical protein
MRHSRGSAPTSKSIENEGAGGRVAVVVSSSRAPPATPNQPQLPMRTRIEMDIYRSVRLCKGDGSIDTLGGLPASRLLIAFAAEKRSLTLLRLAAETIGGGLSLSADGAMILLSRRREGRLLANSVTSTTSSQCQNNGWLRQERP